MGDIVLAWWLRNNCKSVVRVRSFTVFRTSNFIRHQTFKSACSASFSDCLLPYYVHILITKCPHSCICRNIFRRWACIGSKPNDFDMFTCLFWSFGRLHGKLSTKMDRCKFAHYCVYIDQFFDWKLGNVLCTRICTSIKMVHNWWPNCIVLLVGLFHYWYGMVEVTRMVLRARITNISYFSVYCKHMRLNKNLCIPIVITIINVLSCDQTRSD